MKETKYKLRVYSKMIKNEQIFEQILSTPTLSSLVFPGIVYRNPEVNKRGLPAELLLNTPSDFSMNVIPVEFISEDHIYFELYSINGMKFSMRCYLKQTNIHSNFILEFTDRYINSQKPFGKELLAIIIDETSLLFDTRGAEVVHEDAWKDKLSWKIKMSTYDVFSFHFHWLAYIGEEFSNYIGIEKLKSIKKCEEIRKMGKGLLYIFQDEPYDSENATHVAHREKILQQFLKIPLPPQI